VKSGNKGKKPNYGFYFFKPYMLMFATFLVIGVSIFFWGERIDQSQIQFIGVAIVAYGIFTTLGWALARYVIPGNRIKFAKKVVLSLGLKGDETVLDVGTGKGLYAIEVAKLLTRGKVIGIDLWNENEIPDSVYHHKLSQPTGNTILNALKNAQIEGVSEKIHFQNMDAIHLQFDKNSFNIAICAFVIGHLREFGLNALQEIKRVLEPGGRLILIDSFRDMTYFLLSTPHLFVLSYLRGTKAKRLTKRNWIQTINKTGFNICRFKAQKGIIVIEAQI
jgi:ubiquinone/menaquinone biosynthesis C-methylase UbiE